MIVSAEYSGIHQLGVSILVHRSRQVIITSRIIRRYLRV